MNLCSKSRFRQSLSSLFGTNVRAREKADGKRGGAMTSTRHEPVYHAAHGGLAAALSETSACLRGLLWACQVESPKNGGFLAPGARHPVYLDPLTRVACSTLFFLVTRGRLST